MTGFFRIPAAGGGFFLSAWIAMIFWGIIAPEFGIKTVGYVMSMVITIGLWLVVAPLAGAVAGKKQR